jgi:hypothetical protein
MTVDEPQLRSVIDEPLDTVERVARTDFWQIALGNERSVETPFSLRVGPADPALPRAGVRRAMMER